MTGRLRRAASWRPPPRGPDDGPPAPDELLPIVLRSKCTHNTRAAYARELALFFFAFCERGGEAVYSVRAEHVEDYLKRRSRSIGTFDRDFLSWLGADRGAIDTTGPACSM
jgi:hypothetical protein